MDLLRCARMSHIELSHLVQSIIEVVQIFPSVVFNPIALPLEQVLYFLAEQPTVQDLFDNVLFFAFNKLRGRWWGSTSSTGDGVIRCWGQLYHIKDRV